MRLRSLSFLLLISLTGGCAGPALPSSHQTEILPPKAPGQYRETVQIAGLTRRYMLIVPKSYDARRRLPMVVLLHGWMGDAAQILATTGMAAKAEKEGFFVVAPEALGDPKGWNVGFLDLSGENRPDDAAFVTAVLDQAAKEVGVDGDRVFVTGHSNGAMLAHLMGAKLAGRVAAIGAVAGIIGLPDKGETIPAPVSPVSVIMLHGQADKLVGYDDSHPGLLRGIGAPAAAKWWAEKDGLLDPPVRTTPTASEVVDTYSSARGVEVRLVTYPSGSHLWPTDATDLIWAFFVAHPRVR